MKNLLTVVVALAATMVILCSCEDERSPLGGSLVDDKVEIVIDSAFTLTGHSVESPDVQARTILQLLGRMTAENYGTFESTVVSQFMPASTMVTEGVSPATIDSVRLIMRMPVGGYVGDSLAVMGISAYELTSPLPADITSSYIPVPASYTPTPLATAYYSMNGASLDDSIAAQGYRYITLDLGRDFGVRLLEKYQSSPEIFTSPSAFSQWFPGLYIATTFGAGRVAQVDSTVITTYYRQILPIEGASPARDTTIYCHDSYLAVTPEVLTNNNMAYAMASSLRAAAQAGEPILVAPTGYDVEVSFPARLIARRYRSAGSQLTVLNTLQLTIPVEEIANDHGITPPPYVLLVRKSMKDEFFNKSLLPDNVNSFYASYDSYSRCYRFNDMRGYLLKLLDQDEITAADEEFMICPVTIGFEQTANSNSYYYYYYYSAAETQNVVATVTPYVNEPSMARLKLDQAKIKLTYSVQKLNF